MSSTAETKWLKRDKRPVSSQQVFASRDLFEMVRVDTLLHSAEMVELHAWSNRPNHPHVGDPICRIGTEGSISILIGGTHPQPTPVYALRLLDITHE